MFVFVLVLLIQKERKISTVGSCTGEEEKSMAQNIVLMSQNVLPYIVYSFL